MTAPLDLTSATAPHRSPAVRATRGAMRGAPALVGRILAPVDFSSSSLQAADCALNLAEQARATVHLLHVVEPIPLLSLVHNVPLLKTDQEAARDAVHQLAMLAREHPSSSRPISCAAHLGQPTTLIVSIAQAMNADLIVLSTAGRSGLFQRQFGSVAEAVIRGAPCPVLIWPNEFRPGGQASADPSLWRPRRILLPTDFSRLAGSAARYGSRFALQFGAKVTLLHSTFAGDGAHSGSPASPRLQAVLGTAHRHLRQIQAECLPTELLEDAAVRLGDPAAEITAFAEERGFDLIVCGTHGSTGLHHLLLGSTAEAIFQRAHCPVLVISERMQAHSTVR